MKPPYVLLEVNSQRWMVLKPCWNYGNPLDSLNDSDEDRRYEEVAQVSGFLRDALRVLHQLEAGRT